MTTNPTTILAALEDRLTRLHYQAVETKAWHTIWARPPLIQRDQSLPRIWLPHAGAPDFTALIIRAGDLLAAALDDRWPVTSIEHALARLDLHDAYGDPFLRLRATHQLRITLATHQRHLIADEIRTGREWDDIAQDLDDTGLGLLLDHLTHNQHNGEQHK